MENIIDSNLKRIRSTRERQSLLIELEYTVIEKLCVLMPHWVTPNILTVIGLIGSLIAGLSMYLATFNSAFLALGVLGFALQWFGDSLDGRLAYYRNIPRKWYGWSLDINADWISIGVIGLGFYSYFQAYPVVAIIFMLAYGGSMILTLMRYKIANKYQIDKMNIGPSETRLVICLFMLLEIYLPGVLWYFVLVGSIILIIGNMIETQEILGLGDDRDELEKSAKQHV